MASLLTQQRNYTSSYCCLKIQPIRTKTPHFNFSADPEEASGSDALHHRLYQLAAAIQIRATLHEILREIRCSNRCPRALPDFRGRDHDAAVVVEDGDDDLHRDAEEDSVVVVCAKEGVDAGEDADCSRQRRPSLRRSLPLPVRP